MKIINNQNYFSDKQINNILKLLGEEYIPNKIIICEYRKDILSLFKNIPVIGFLFTLFDITVWLGQVEGVYLTTVDCVIVYIFSQHDDGDNKNSYQLYSLHAMVHELRHGWQIKNKFVGDKEIDADNFATKFVNENSKQIAKIMKWKYEWEVEED